MLLKYIKLIGYCTLIIMAVTSCEIEEISDPNDPTRSAIESNATVGELNNLVVGIESLMRDELGFYYDVVGIIGREYYFFTDADPRYTGELLGKGESQLDEAGFYGTRPYGGRYRVILNANILMTAVKNTTEPITESERNGYIGFAKTAQAYSYLLALNLQYENGIRMDVSDPDNLGPFLSYADALGAISALLDEANTALTNAGDEFNFQLSSGFSGFGTPTGFAAFNRAIKARVEMYRGNNEAVLNALKVSFLDLDSTLTFGPAHFYSTSGNDVANPLFRFPGQAEALIAHPSFVTDIRPGDFRYAKTAPRLVATADGLTGNRDVVLYSSLSAPIPIIRNEELILLYAEANIGTDNAEAVDALNIIRNAHGLGDYAGLMTDAALVDELLYNRRYSLFGEGHRWIDLRRYGRLDELPIDRAGDDVWQQLPRPVSENQ